MLCFTGELADSSDDEDDDEDDDDFDEEDSDEEDSEVSLSHRAFFSKARPAVEAYRSRRPVGGALRLLARGRRGVVRAVPPPVLSQSQLTCVFRCAAGRRGGRPSDGP